MIATFADGRESGKLSYAGRVIPAPLALFSVRLFDLDRRNIGYAVVGAIALNQHGFPRLTVDIDLLLSPDGLERFRDELIQRGVLATVRRTRGDDIDAACGQLAGRVIDRTTARLGNKVFGLTVQS